MLARFMLLRSFPALLLLVCALQCARTAAAEGDSTNSSIGQHKKTYSALCIIAKNENKYIREWIDYHKCLGIGQIHVYDHESSTRLNTLFQDDIDSGFMTYRYFEGYHKKGFTNDESDFMKKAQGYAYTRCIEEFGDDHTFIGFIDVDEFLTIEDEKATSINDVLKEFEDYGGVSFHWRIIGPSGHQNSPTTPVVDSYTDCLPRGFHFHRQIKSFINTKFNPVMISAHRARFLLKTSETSFMVDENKKRLEMNMVNKPSWNKIGVYHYATKSKEDFLAKMKRGGAAGITRGFKYFNSINLTSVYGLNYRQKKNPEPKIIPCLAAQSTRKRLCNSF